MKILGNAIVMDHDELVENDFGELKVLIDDEEININVIGALIFHDLNFIVISDVPEFQIGPDEYDILLWVKRGNGDFLVPIPDDELRTNVCREWEGNDDSEQLPDI